RAPVGAELLSDARDVAVHGSRVALFEGRERMFGQLVARDGAPLTLDQVGERLSRSSVTFDHWTTRLGASELMRRRARSRATSSSIQNGLLMKSAAPKPKQRRRSSRSTLAVK